MKYNIKKDSYKFEEKTIDFFINIGLQLTRKCNLLCVHCCEPEQIDDLPFERIKLLVDKLVTDGLEKICITGGEPFLRKDLVPILEYIHGKGIYVTLSTNGTMVDKLKLKAIKPFVNNIRFSLHGKEKTHEKIRIFW